MTGGFGVKGPFWALVSEWISPANKAAGIAMINSLANVSGFVAPFLLGFIKDQTGSFALGLLPMILMALVGAAVVLAMSRSIQRPSGALPWSELAANNSASRRAGPDLTGVGQSGLR
ncbi:hypothetical protein [Bradyrhizobium sp. STM 3562]|uniref:hypothetical protein n=1 Tax=Bradyrhizobium sp. STM 3562 TaxID=578924 RepID=UPI00388E0625